jgi:hypothetical protein
VRGVLEQELAIGALMRSKGVVRGPAGAGGGGVRSFFEVLEADLIQAATLLSGAPPAAPEPPRRRLRWRP